MFGDYKIKQKLNIDKYYTSFNVKLAFFTVFVLTLQTVLRLAGVFRFLKMTLVLNTFAHSWFILCTKKHESKKSISADEANFLKPILLKGVQMCSTTRPFAQNLISCNFQHSKTWEQHENKEKLFELNGTKFTQFVIRLELPANSVLKYRCSLKQTFAQCKVFLEGKRCKQLLT